MDETNEARVRRVAEEITLGLGCEVRVTTDQLIDALDEEIILTYVQIACWRPDAFTGEMDFGYSSRVEISPQSSDQQVVGAIFGLFKGYWEHEAREHFQWRGRRIFGPHISLDALWEVARRVDIPSARHVGDVPERGLSAEARQRALSTMTCAWCGIAANGTAHDLDGALLPTCGQEGHGKA